MRVIHTTTRVTAATALITGCMIGSASPTAAEEPHASASAAPASGIAASSDRGSTFAAQTVLSGTDGNLVDGTVEFRLRPDGRLAIEGRVTGLAPGAHGFHVHENGDCSAPDATSAGGHFDPDRHPHGAPAAPADAHHAGDLGNVTANARGVARIDMTSDVLAVTGDHGVRGHALIVHAGEDDLRSQPSGDAGERVACGVIVTRGASARTG